MKSLSSGCHRLGVNAIACVLLGIGTYRLGFPSNRRHTQKVRTGQTSDTVCLIVQAIDISPGSLDPVSMRKSPYVLKAFRKIKLKMPKGYCKHVKLPLSSRLADIETASAVLTAGVFLDGQP
jgi:hypothetical protein